MGHIPPRPFILLTLLICLCGLTGCMPPSFTPDQQQLQIDNAKKVVDSLKGVSTQLGEVTTALHEASASAATQPGGTKFAAIVEKAVQPTDHTKEVVDAVTHVADTFSTAMQNQQAQNADVLTKIVAVTQTAHEVTHDVAPGTKTDETTALVAIAALAVSKIVSSFNNKSALKTAITTPGTTTTPGA